VLLAERGQHVIGPYSGSCVQNNHSKSGTTFKTCHDGTRAVLRINRSGHVKRDHGGAGVQAPDALVREALNRCLTEGEESSDGSLRRYWLHARQNHMPLRRLEH
jgi:hypothetical protein